MIGIFDSGSGGLTVLRAIRERMSGTDIIYFGDIKNAPYGSKTPAELSHLTFSAFSFLVKRGATSIVSACNSVSSSLAVSLLDAGDISSDHLIEMVGPTVRYFKHADSKILLCATPATIKSEIYQNAFSMIGKEIQTLPIPELAGAIESGASEEKIEEIIRIAFSQIPQGSFSVLILACTHYPLVMNVFKKVLGERVLIFDPAEAVAERVAELWWPREAGNGKMTFLISADSERFRRFVTEFFPKDAEKIEVVE
jgi:glutamate racemase